MTASDADFLCRLETVSTATEAFVKSSLGEAPLAGEIAGKRVGKDETRGKATLMAKLGAARQHGGST